MDTPVRFGAFIIYANGEFEAERPTCGGAKRTIAMLRRLGLVPTVRRHAWAADGRHMNVDCGTKNLKVRPERTAAAPAAPLAAIAAPAAGPRAVHYENAYGVEARLSFTVLCF